LFVPDSGDLVKADVSKAKVMFDEVMFAVIVVECAFQALSSLGKSMDLGVCIGCFWSFHHQGFLETTFPF